MRNVSAKLWETTDDDLNIIYKVAGRVMGDSGMSWVVDEIFHEKEKAESYLLSLDKSE